jgi:hypothetical protein
MVKLAPMGLVPAMTIAGQDEKCRTPVALGVCEMFDAQNSTNDEIYARSENGP